MTFDPYLFLLLGAAFSAAVLECDYNRSPPLASFEFLDDRYDDFVARSIVSEASRKALAGTGRRSCTTFKVLT